jgi:hypothetical protein
MASMASSSMRCIAFIIARFWLAFFVAFMITSLSEDGIWVAADTCTGMANPQHSIASAQDTITIFIVPAMLL